MYWNKHHQKLMIISSFKLCNYCIFYDTFYIYNDSCCRSNMDYSIINDCSMSIVCINIYWYRLITIDCWRIKWLPTAHPSPSTHWKHLLPQFFNEIQSNLFTECIQDQFLKDCTSKHLVPIIIIIIIIKKGRQCKAEREWCTPYQSEDQSPTIPTYRQKEEKGKKSRRL